MQKLKLKKLSLLVIVGVVAAAGISCLSGFLGQESETKTAVVDQLQITPQAGTDERASDRAVVAPPQQGVEQTIDYASFFASAPSVADDPFAHDPDKAAQPLGGYCEAGQMDVDGRASCCAAWPVCNNLCKTGSYACGFKSNYKQCCSDYILIKGPKCTSATQTGCKI